MCYVKGTIPVAVYALDASRSTFTVQAFASGMLWHLPTIR